MIQTMENCYPDLDDYTQGVKSKDFVPSGYLRKVAFIGLKEFPVRELCLSTNHTFPTQTAPRQHILKASKHKAPFRVSINETLL